MKPFAGALCLAGLSLSLVAVGCDSASGDATPTPTPTPTPVPAACLTSIPAPSTDPNRPVITLRGPRILSLQVGTPYSDAGATAADPAEGDISGRIVITGLDTLSTAVAGDFLVRYNVANSTGLAATEVVRIVRVTNGQFTRQTKRDYGTTSAVMGYFEHLPPDYSDDPARTYPLIVYHHGYGENADVQQTVGDQYSSSPDKLDLLLRRGLSGILDHGIWDDTRSFIVLSPQRCVGFTNAHVESFVQYAVNTYHVDPSRIYMMGFSAGAFETWDHIHRNPSQLAAAVTISGGGGTSAACVMKDTPTWSFHAADDGTVPVHDSIDTVAAMKACGSTVPHKLTVYPSGGHLIDIQTLELVTMGLGDPQYDVFDQNLYTWLLQFTRPVAEAHAEAPRIEAVGGDAALTLSIQPEAIAFGGEATIEWRAAAADSCEASGDWTGARPESGTERIVPPAPGVYGYVLTCEGLGGSVARAVTLTVTER